MNNATRILQSLNPARGDSAAELSPLVYEQLRTLAAHKMAAEPEGHTLQATTLVHEAWRRLTGSPDLKWVSRPHFFAAPRKQ